MCVPAVVTQLQVIPRNLNILMYHLTQLFLDVKAIFITKLEVRAFKTEDKSVW
jgi:hypothetical protein